MWLDFQIHFKVAVGFEIKEDEKRLSSKIMGENFFLHDKGFKIIISLSWHPIAFMSSLLNDRIIAKIMA